MIMAGRINRREFIKRSAAAGTIAGAGLNLSLGKTARCSVVSYDRNDSPNGRITLGFIGVGARAQDVMSDVLKMPGFEVVGVCDAYKGRITRVMERTSGRAKVYKDHRELLAASD